MDVRLAGRKVVIMGLGRFGGGVDAARFAAGAGARVLVTDRAAPEQLRESMEQLSDLPNVEFRLGLHDPEDFATADVVIANPAVPPDNEFLQMAHRGGKSVTSQMGLFFDFCPATIIGITGANGKSTTASLTAHILERARPRTTEPGYGKVWLSGNIGDKPLLTILDQIAPRDLVVLEISSFQIEQLAQVRKGPHVALLTNLTPNHLDRYGTFEAYCQAKEHLFRSQPLDGRSRGVSLFNAEDAIGRIWFERYRGEPGRTCRLFSADDVSEEVRSSYPLPGRANLSNLAAAMAIARCFDVSDETIRDCLSQFRGLPHRLELVRDTNGVRWYNDSKATTPEGTMVALAAFDCPKILIAGGYDKHTPFDELGKVIAAGTKVVILLGQTAEKIARAIRTAQASDGTVDIHLVASLEEAVGLANRLALAGDVILLSPACASYDMFENYQQRGRLFAELASDLNRRL